MLPRIKPVPVGTGIISLGFVTSELGETGRTVGHRQFLLDINLGRRGSGGAFGVSKSTR